MNIKPEILVKYFSTYLNLSTIKFFESKLDIEKITINKPIPRVNDRNTIIVDIYPFASNEIDTNIKKTGNTHAKELRAYADPNKKRDE